MPSLSAIKNEQAGWRFDRPIQMVLWWLVVGGLASWGVAVMHALVRPLPPTTTVISTDSGNFTASRFELRFDAESVVVGWRDILGFSPPVYAEDYGWPTRCFSVWHEPVTGGSWRLIAGIPIGLDRPATAGISPALDPIRALPIVPRPLLFVINTAAFATILFGAWRFVLALRSRHRRRRGRCGRCGYGPWIGQGPCPECGHPTSRRNEAVR